MPRKDLHEENRVSWNSATDAHNSHKLDQAAFFRNGGSTLFPEEVELLGAIRGLDLVHLQCNAGQDTLSLARLGARVTGVDISDTAIDFARQLAADSGIAATFVRSDVYDWFEQAQGAQYDVAFSSYGALVWLSDLAAWGRGVAGALRPGGRFVIVDFHPIVSIFDWDWNITEPYFAPGQTYSYPSGVGDYVAMSGAALAPMGYLEGTTNYKNPYPGHEFQWTLNDIVGALTDAGLLISALREYPYMNGAKLLADMREGEGRRMYPPERLPSLPLMYGLAALKPGQAAASS